MNGASRWLEASALNDREAAQQPSTPPKMMRFIGRARFSCSAPGWGAQSHYGRLAGADAAAAEFIFRARAPCIRSRLGAVEEAMPTAAARSLFARVLLGSL